MAKITLDDLSTTLANSAASTLNNNNTKIEAALEKTLSRDGTGPNQMEADLDLNGNDLLNVQTLTADIITLDGAVLVPGSVTAIPPGSIGTTFLADGAVTNVKLADAGLIALANLSTSADKLPYSTGSDTWALTDLSAYGRSLINNADATTARATLGLVIGTNVQAYDVGLASIAGLTTAADRMIYTTASDTYAVTTLTTFGRSLIDDVDASTALSTLGVSTYAKTLLDDVDATATRTTLGLTIGTDVQAFDTDLTAIAALVSAANKLPYATGAGTWALADLSAFGRTLVDDVDAATARATLGVFQALSGTATYDPPSLADAAGASTTVTVTGAALGDVALASFSLSTQGITVTANVTATDTVTVRFQNETGGVLDLASGTLKAVVFK